MSTGARVSVGGAADRWRSLLDASSVRYAAGVVLIAAGYYTAAQGGEALLLTGPAGAFWPATGVGIAVLYLGGMRWWPGVLLGDLLSREWTELPLGTALAESAGNTARALVAVLIIRRLAGPRAGMDRLEHVGAVLLGVAVGEALSATIAMFALRAGDVIEASELGVFWRSWWLGGVSGGLVVVPLALAWARGRAEVWRARGALETTLMLTAVVGLSAIALSADQPLAYVVFPAFIWAALHFGPQGATVAVAVATVIAVWVTANDAGAFHEVAAGNSALNLQLYITVAALTTLCLAAIVSERQRAAGELAESRARIAAAGALERRRLEAELHDGAQNRLFTLQMDVRAAQERSARSAPELTGSFDVIIDDARAVGDELRRIAHGLSPPLLATHGLVDALRAEARHSAIPVEIAGGNIGSSEPSTELAVYFSCLESIQNAVKHAGPGATIAVRFSRDGDDLRFSIRDTGRGFDPRSAPRGAGLDSIHDRIETLGGHVDVDPGPGRGTTVACVVPWPPRAD